MVNRRMMLGVRFLEERGKVKGKREKVKGQREKVKGQRGKVKVKITNHQLSEHCSEPSPLLFSRRGERKG